MHFRVQPLHVLRVHVPGDVRADNCAQDQRRDIQRRGAHERTGKAAHGHPGRAGAREPVRFRGARAGQHHRGQRVVRHLYAVPLCAVQGHVRQGGRAAVLPDPRRGAEVVRHDPVVLALQNHRKRGT